MKTIAVLSRKGGSGKTTVSVSLAIAAQQAGLKVVLVDIDPLRSAGVILWKREDAASLLVEASASKLRTVQDLCRRKGCDLLIVDTPPAPESDVARAIDIADLCLAVARPSALDLAAINETVELVVRRRRQGLVVLNQCPPRRSGVEAALTLSALEKLEFAKLPLASARLRSRVAYQHAARESRSVTEWSPASEAAAELLRLLAEISDLLFRGRAHGERAQAFADAAAREIRGTDRAAEAASDAMFGQEPWSPPVLNLLALASGGMWSGPLD